MAVMVVLNLTGLPAAADTKTYEDGTWSGTATVNPDDDDDFDAYDIKINVTVKDGKISDVSLDSSTGISTGNSKYFERAATKGRGDTAGLFSQIVDVNGTDGVDTVSTATCSSKGIIAAVESALSGHEKKRSESDSESSTSSDAESTESGTESTESGAESTESDAESTESAAESTESKAESGEEETENKIVYYDMNIPFDVFYAGITPSVASSIDTVTTATTKGKAQQYLDSGNYYGANANEIAGVTIPVAMDQDTYEAVKDQVSSSTSDYYIGDEVSDPSVYLTLTLSESGSFIFSELSGEKTSGGTISITEAWQTKRRDIEITLGETLASASELYGGYVTTTDGTAYPLLPMESMYKASELYTIGWSLGDKLEQRNSSDALVMTLQPEIFSSMKGKTLDSMTIFTTSGIVTYALRDAETSEAVTMTYPSEETEDPTEETTEEPVYVWMNIPYSEFYAAEGTTDVDAVSSATQTKTRTVSLVGGSYHVNSDGTDITGVTYPVKVTDASVLESLKQVTDEDSYEISTTNRGTTTTTTFSGKDALFENETYAYYLMSEEPSYYKELTVNADGSFSFGKAVGTETSATKSAELLAGDETSYGDYEIDFEDYTPETVYGVVIHTAEGGTYALKHLENIWRNFEYAIGTGHTTTVHNCPIQSYEEAEGQTVTSMTFYTDNGIEEITLETPLYLAPIASGFTAEAENENTVVIEGLPADMTGAQATVTYQEGSGRTAVTHTVVSDVTITDGKVDLGSETLTDGMAYKVKVTSDNYAPGSASFTYTASEEAVSYTIISGANGTWTKGSGESYTLVSDAPYEKFSAITLNGETVDEEKYAVVSGSTEVTFTAEYLESLDAGTYSVSIVSEDGVASTSLTVKEAASSEAESSESSASSEAESGESSASSEVESSESSEESKAESTSGTVIDAESVESDAASGTSNEAETESASNGATATASASKGGSASATNNSASASKSTSAKTGDTQFDMVILYIGVLVLAAAAVILVVRRNRKSR